MQQMPHASAGVEDESHVVQFAQPPRIYLPFYFFDGELRFILLTHLPSRQCLRSAMGATRLRESLSGGEIAPTAP